MYLNKTAVFSEVNETICSKDFKGGKISNLFGETNLDFTDADISGEVVLDISQAFGEIKITVPKNWEVRTDLSQFLASTRDKRQPVTPLEKSDKVLVLIGNLAFGEIKIIAGSPVQA